MPIKNIPQHVAIIPDGNRRWARKKGFQPWIGHRAGSSAMENLCEKALELKIPYLTIWGASWDNLTKRSKPEVNFLFEVFTDKFKKLAKDKSVHEDKVKISVLGPWQKILPNETQQAINRAVDATKDYNNYHLTFLLAYDGRQEMVDCVRKISESNKSQDMKIDADLVKQNLWTSDLPPVDFLIRTGSAQDPHNSAGFMMWHTAHSQLYFTETFFPDFQGPELEAAVENYSKRERRMGR
ncbi:di-trans,poly-cis-decaprenylcistransferase [Patescibacteria group bacterium]|nr:di-trans,poly-cis-decaprenylcistransferase [Patescibacteria group bacterium]MBU1921752.1 di-trans,poly-cis-decaprenylcistransferase [Patescibacteria group bacterium]